jgi:hypothetical protein
MRISNSKLQQLIDNPPIDSKLYELILDLRDERNRTEVLQEEIKRLERIINMDKQTSTQFINY